MRLSEILAEMASGGASCAGSVATVPGGFSIGMQKRKKGSEKAGIYEDDLDEDNEWLKGNREKPAKFAKMAEEFKTDPALFAKWIATMNQNKWLDGNMAELVQAGITWDDIEIALNTPYGKDRKVFPYVADKLRAQYGA